MTGVYLDASAVVKLFKPEPESKYLADALKGYELWASSEVVAVEAACAARRAGDLGLMETAGWVVAQLDLLPFTPSIRQRAAGHFDNRLRALDAIHAATSLSVAHDLPTAVAYDIDLIQALAAEGIEVLAPGAL